MSERLNCGGGDAYQDGRSDGFEEGDRTVANKLAQVSPSRVSKGPWDVMADDMLGGGSTYGDASTEVSSGMDRRAFLKLAGGALLGGVAATSGVLGVLKLLGGESERERTYRSVRVGEITAADNVNVRSTPVAMSDMENLIGVLPKGAKMQGQDILLTDAGADGTMCGLWAKSLPEGVLSEKDQELGRVWVSRGYLDFEPIKNDDGNAG